LLQEISTQQLGIRSGIRLAAVIAVSFLCLSATAKNSDVKNLKTQSPAAKQTIDPAPATSGAKATNAATPKKPSTIAPTAEQRGERIFKKAYCIGCHAGGGNALMPDKPIKGKAFSDRYVQDSVLEQTIRKGFPASGMPEFGKDQISERQMKDLILYIRSFTPKKGT
jgi:mono/diheme cytochrome c family protein